MTRSAHGPRACTRQVAGQHGSDGHSAPELPPGHLPLSRSVKCASSTLRALRACRSRRRRAPQRLGKPRLAGAHPSSTLPDCHRCLPARCVHLCALHAHPCARPARRVRAGLADWASLSADTLKTVADTPMAASDKHRASRPCARAWRGWKGGQRTGVSAAESAIAA